MRKGWLIRIRAMRKWWLILNREC